MLTGAQYKLITLTYIPLGLGFDFFLAILEANSTTSMLSYKLKEPFYTL